MIALLLDRLAAVHMTHRRVASGALAIGALVFIAKLFVAAREMAIAWRYGVSTTVDSYQLALTITTWLPMLLIGVATAVLVPRLIALGRGSAERSQFVHELNGAVLLVGIAVSVGTWLVAPSAARWLAGSGDPILVTQTVSMARRMAPIALFVVGIGYLSARLQSRERFAYSVSEAVPAAVIALFVLATIGGEAAIPLILGTLIGYLLQLALLTWMAGRSDPPVGGLAFAHRSSEWRSLYGSLLLMAGGQALLSLTIPIDQAFAARLGEGAVATLGYANRVVTLVTGMGTIVLARALLPVLSSEVAEGDRTAASRHARQWAWLLLIGGSCITAMGWLLAPRVVTILFERGAFTPSATAAVTQVLQFGLLQVPFYFAGLALVQWFAATGRYQILLFVAAFALTGKIAMNLLLLPFGLMGIMAATAGMYALSFLAQYFFAVRSR